MIPRLYHGRGTSPRPSVPSSDIGQSDAGGGASSPSAGQPGTTKKRVFLYIETWPEIASIIPAGLQQATTRTRSTFNWHSMNADLKDLIQREARAHKLTVAPSFFSRADWYIGRHFAKRPAREKLIIDSYLAQAAIRIAKTEGKRALQADDHKAATWLFHIPVSPDDPCLNAGLKALRAEKRRTPGSRGLLLQSFAKHLNRGRTHR